MQPAQLHSPRLQLPHHWWRWPCQSQMGWQLQPRVHVQTWTAMPPGQKLAWHCEAARSVRRCRCLHQRLPRTQTQMRRVTCELQS